MITLTIAHRNSRRVSRRGRNLQLRLGEAGGPKASPPPDASGDVSWTARLEAEILRREVAALIEPFCP
jgi:hypothetical protein